MDSTRGQFSTYIMKYYNPSHHHCQHHRQQQPQQQHQQRYCRHGRCCRCRWWWWWWRCGQRGWWLREQLLMVLLSMCGAVSVIFLCFVSGPSVRKEDIDIVYSPKIGPGKLVFPQAASGYHSLGEDQEELNGYLRMGKRQKLLSSFCSSHVASDPSEVTDPTIFRTNVIVSRRRPLLYCPVGKVASTFLTRFLVAAEETHPVESPYVISPQKALRMRRKNSGTNILFAPLHRMADMAGMEEKEFVGSVTRVIVVRCPFQRLWSAYVDKLLFPNPHYWRTWGYPAMKALNVTANTGGLHGEGSHKAAAAAAASSASTHCGHNVSFSQFLRFALTHLFETDTHIRPVAHQCAPCYVNYDVICHVTTLISDVLHLSQVLQLNSSRLQAVAWEEERAQAAMQEGVETVLQERSGEIRQCLTLQEAARRLWRVLQIRGVIGEDVAFPASSLSGESLTSSALQTALQKARAVSGRGPELLQQQKTTALRSAYRSVSPQLKARIAQLYAADFRMFGFDPGWQG